MLRVIGSSWRMSQSRTLVAGVVAAVIALVGAGCGDDGATVAQQATSAPPAATAPAATDVPTTTTPTTVAATGTTTAPTATTGVPPGGTATGESQAGGAGDEEAVRVPAAFRVSGSEISPSSVTVPAFLPIALAITSVGEQRRITVDVPGVEAFDVAAGGTARKTIAGGLKPGDYTITAQGGGHATLHVTPGGDAGP